ncbi:hypothetical protein MHU86_17231 [Fragilaria crotonensis]|nr:hypothetical protein MHU86_17231 [Fragilaria crotonensis]
MTSVIDPTGAVGTAAIQDPPPPYANPPGAALNPEGRETATAPTIIFALTPAQAVADLYDYSKAKDAKIYKTATDSLNTKHDGTIATLRPMLDELLMRAKDYNWNSLIMIKDNEGKMCNIILQNRALTMENVMASTISYLGTQSRMAQDNYLMVQCILNSLDTEGSKALRSSQYSYNHNGEPSAALLIKVLLLDCEVETASTNFFVRAQLGELEQFMVTIDYNVVEFNKHVSELLRKLRQGGEETHDDVLFIYMHVMKAYLICPDQDFLLAIKLQKIKAEADPKLLTLPILMISAQKSYQMLVQEGTYNAPQTHESKLVALAAKYATPIKKEGKGYQAKGKNDRPKKPDWMAKAPTDNVTTKSVDGKHYNWCTYHKKWGFHKEADCYVRLKQVAAAEANASIATTTSAASTTGSESTTSRLTMSAAIAAVLDDDDNSSYAAFPSVVNAAATSATASASSANKKVISFDSASFTILVDNGASRCMTNDVKHFIGTPTVVSKKVTGLGAGNVTLEGTVRWRWEDDQGKCHTVDIPNTLYCADLAFCLLSPQHLAAEKRDNSPKPRGTWLATFADAMVLQWGQRQYQRTIKLSSSNAFVGIMRSAPGYKKSTKFLNLCALALPPTPMCFPAPLLHVEVPAAARVAREDTHDENVDTDDIYNWVFPAEPIRQDPLRFDFDSKRAGQPPSILPKPDTADTNNEDPAIAGRTTEQTQEEDSIPIATGDPAKHELLRMHHCLGHMPFALIRIMIKESGTYRNRAHLLTCPIPVCSACLFGKATKRAWRSKGHVSTLEPAQAPGDIVSMDQLESSTPGLVAQSKGKSTHKRFTCATVFVDHYSRLSFVHMQETNNALETLAAKHAFERFALSHNVTVKRYHGDNGRFSDNDFRSACRTQGQQLTFCGVNAHFQNGIAERRIRDLQDRARTMIVHAKHRWSNAITSNLWPYAIRLANDSSRCIPIREGKNPLQLFTGHDFQVSAHQHLHPFGCPMYVLKDEPASGKKGAKWGERARCGIYLGLSPEHARSVCLVMSLTTGLVSPQFHVKADDNFETVHSNVNTPVPIFPSMWQRIHGFTDDGTITATVSHQPHARKPPPARLPTRKTPPTYSLKPTPKAPVIAPSHDINKLPPPRISQQDSDSSSDESEGDNLLDLVARAPNYADAYEEGPHPPRDEAVPLEYEPPAIVTPQPFTAGPIGHVRPRRTSRRPPRRLIEDTAFPAQTQSDVARCGTPLFQEDPNTFLHDMKEYLLQNSLDDPIAFSAASSDPDTMYLHEAMRQPDWPQFQQAMRDEVTAHENRRHWKLVRREAIPAGIAVLPSVWSMKRKRRIATREVYKWKARLNAHGGKQVQGVNYWETYAPVVHWASIRLHLILALINKHHTRQIDFVLAYPQADAECEIYMEIPRGFTHEGQRKTHALRLLKNIYGTRQAGRVWNKHLHAGLMERGYRQSSVDHCVYYKGSTVFLIYVDDGIFIGPDSKEIDALISSLKSDASCRTSFDITDEGQFSDYLGVKVDHLEGGQIRLSQPHLIQQIINDLDFKENTKPKNIPAIPNRILNRDHHGKDFDEPWAYRSVVGKLNFLEKSTRADISYAVHQCARFATFPKQSHADAVRCIVRYLIGTKEEGLILDPSNASFDCFVDADFCGTWNPETAEGDASTSKSRTGFVIKYAGCPIVWQSKLQTETALSTTEAEYIALSSSLREVISLMELLKEAKAHGIPNVVVEPKIHCKVFEDNSGALAMAQTPKMRPRTKHLNVKYHHFRNHVTNGEITLHAISSEDQQADIYTKPLATVLFMKLRRAILGW